ncbi:hypothetical protein SDC9_207915 [bioreactor metagenome]|uniref:Uncharacterized protein n=1 Tax=bioreactor metagenome TaxID=1076179 RepID=A0A645JAK4_9ZZZZ
MTLITLPQPLENGKGRSLVRLTYYNRLKAAFKRRVFFDITAIFVKRSSSDDLQISTPKDGFDDVGGVNGSFSASRTHNSMEFINK